MDKNNMDWGTFLKVVIAATLLVCAILMGWLAIQLYQIRNIVDAREESRGTLDSIISTMSEIKSIYDSQYIGELYNDMDAEDRALYCFAMSYNDKYGGYLPPKNTVEASETRMEHIVGIGVNVVYEQERGLYVIKVYKGSPAEDCGIQSGDYIVQIDGKSFSDTSYEDFVALISGEINTTVKVGLNRSGKLMEVTAVRKDVVTHSVNSEVISNSIVKIDIDRFTNFTDEELKTEIDAFLSNGYKKFILDLRDNTGGAAETVISMLDYMIPEGLIVRFIGKDEGEVTEYYSDASCVEGEYVILVNEYTASASELFSKVLQESGKAVVAGKNTFGKGTVVSTYTLGNGGSLVLSTAKYYTASGDEIEGNGVTPDYEVDLDEGEIEILYKLSIEDDEQMQKAIEILSKES